jgi:hypothetical protein
MQTLFISAVKVIGSNYQDVPLHLSERVSSFSTLILLLLSFSFIVIAFSRLSSRVLFVNIMEAIYKNTRVSKIVQINYPLSTLSSILLLLNYIISMSALLFLTIQIFQPINNQDILYMALIAAFLVVFPLFSMFSVGVLVGNKNIFPESMINTVVFAHATGLIYSIILLIWTFNSQWSLIFVSIFLGIAVFFAFYRILRGFISAFKKGVSWYYIILYLCTLEILPFILLYQFLR